jgi:ketosteroid isomerase-like protein
MRTLAFILLSAFSCCVVLAEETTRSCEQLSYDYAKAWDHNDAEGFADLFTADALLVLPGNRRMQGREAILQGQHDRDSAFEMRHLITNVYVDMESDDQGSGITYVLVFGESRPEDAQGPLATQGIRAVAEYHDQFVIEDGVCRFFERLTVPVFTFPME